MDERDWLAERFEEQRARLRAVAYRMLGSLERGRRRRAGRLAAGQPGRHREVDNLAGWLTTVVARVCLNLLRAGRRRGARSRWTCTCPTRSSARRPGVDPEDEALLADSVGLALLVVLDTLTPAERLAFVLHDMFARAVRRDRPDGRPVSGRRPPAGQPGPAPGAGRRPRRPTPTWPGSARWSTRSSPPPATATSRRWSRCSIPTWCCAPTAARRRPAADCRHPAARERSPSRPLAGLPVRPVRPAGPDQRRGRSRGRRRRTSLCR